MDQVLQIDLIVDAICEFCDFKTLKNLRLMNSRWNKYASRQLRARCRPIPLRAEQTGCIEQGDFAKYRVLETNTRLHQISANLPVEVFINESSIHCRSRRKGPASYYWTCQNLLSAPWVANVVALHVTFDMTHETVHLPATLLNALPALRRLDLQIFCCKDAPKMNPHQVDIDLPIQVQVDRPSQLEYISFAFHAAHVGEYDDQRKSFPTPDLTFLRRCPSLKTFAVTCNRWPEMLAAFWTRWKELTLQEPDQLPRCQQLEFSSKGYPQSTASLDAITNFINFNKPTMLQVEGFDLSTLVAGLQPWAGGIKTLVTTILIHGEHYRELRPDVLMNFLKEFEIFTDLTDLCITYSTDTPCGRLSEFGMYRRKVHELRKLESLRFASPDEGFWNRHAAGVLQRAAFSGIPIAHVHLIGVPLKFYGTETHTRRRINFGALFKACRRFEGLWELSMEVVCKTPPDELCLSKMVNDKHAGRTNCRSGSYFKGVGVLEQLVRLNVTVIANGAYGGFRTSAETLLLAFFHGYYEPHVQLRLQTKPWPLTVQKVYRHKLEFSVEEFRKAMVDAEKVVGNNWKEEVCRLKCKCQKFVTDI